MAKIVDFFKIFHLPEASTVAHSFEVLYDFIFWFSVISFVIVIGGMFYFLWKYRRSAVNPEKTTYITGHTPTESGVAIILFLVAMVMFFWGWRDYKVLLTAPADSIEINVVGKQWIWEFEYTNGRKMVNKIVVPRGKPVKMLMTSADVIHSFFVPDFRIKQDIIPKAYTTVWFNAIENGEHVIFCAEYCGTAHSKMLAKVIVVDPKEYERWQITWELEQKLGIQLTDADTPTVIKDEKVAMKDTFEKPADEEKEEKKEVTKEPVVSTADRGKKVFASKGCTACHSATGAVLVGPPINGIFGHMVELKDGSKVKVDENYLRQSIMDPQATIVKGFQPLMPTYRGTLTDDEINALVAYIKSLK